MPNIIIFLVDDMGLMDSAVPFLVDSAGQAVRYPLNDFYRTPHLAKLAQQGIRFSQFYAHSVCSPTRASILTGQNAARHRITNWIKSEDNNRTTFGPTDWNWKGLNQQSVTLPRLLQQAGYRTMHIGKAHLGPIGSQGENPLQLGFDINIAGNSYGQPGSYYGQDGYGHRAGQQSRAVPDLEAYHGQDIFLTEALTREAKAAITQAKQADQPFFLHLAHYAVHAPFQPDPRYAEHYQSSDQSEAAQAYATLIEGIDQSLGDIMQHVKDLGLGDNTLLLFLGDNGSDAPLAIENGYSSSVPLRGKKGNHWEGGMRVPFVAAWVNPQAEHPAQAQLPIAQGAIQTQMGTILDIFPTLCQLTDVTPPEAHPLDGWPLQPQLNDQANPQRPEIFLNHFPHGEHRSNYFTSFVQGDWKIIYHYPIENELQYELYNLRSDPFESNNLAKAQPDRLRQMIIAMQKQLSDYRALFPEKEGKKLEVVMPDF